MTRYKGVMFFFCANLSTLKLQGILVLTILDHITMIFFTVGKSTEWKEFFKIHKIYLTPTPGVSTF